MISSIEEILSDFKAGQFVILVDDENRENEGDLIIAADFVKAEHVNFMAKHARGLICLSITQEQADRLKLTKMVSPFHETGKTQTAFTLSIEASSGISTGISAADRAHTIQVASRPGALASDVICPGHVFPLIAHKDGVLAREGHTEASVDLAKLVGVSPSSVICEVINDDGTMARLSDLVVFAKQHHLKIGTIADLVKYRRRLNEK